MSLTLYIYKVKKGANPNCNAKEWACYRRAYVVYDAVSKHESTKDKNGWTIYPLAKDDLQTLRDYINNKPFRFGVDEDELAICNLLKRKKDFENYDFYVLNA